MRGHLRPLWSMIILLWAGCQSAPVQTAALFNLAPESCDASPEPALANGPRPHTLLSRFHPHAKATAQARDEPDASASARRAGHEHRHPAVEPKQAAATTATSPAAVPDSAQQIILTLEAATDPPASTDAVTERADPGADWSGMPIGHRSTSSHPLGNDADLAAPQPRGTSAVSPAAPETADGPEVTESGRGFVASVFDVFGVGGERAAAKDEADLVAAPAIQPPGRTETSTDPAQAVADAAELRAMTSLQSVYWQEDLDKLIALLEAQVAQQKPGDSPAAREHYIRQHVALRMLYLIASRRAETLEAIPGVPHDDQEFWIHLFWALSSTFDDEAMPSSAVRAAETVNQLQAAIHELERRASLQLQRTVFCRQIDGFGDFVPFEEDRFSPGQPVLIYTEVGNFQTQSSTEGDFRSILRSTITIREQSVGGRTVFENVLPPSEDRCLSRRRDYFHSYRVQLPAALKPGPHVLTLQVTDVLSGKTASTALNFVVE